MSVFPNETLQFLLTSQPQCKKPIFFYWKYGKGSITDIVAGGTETKLKQPSLQQLSSYQIQIMCYWKQMFLSDHKVEELMGMDLRKQKL